MSLTKDETRDLYRRRAGHYDWSVRVYPLFGIDVEFYRRKTVEALALDPGDTVVELGCGTGLNFKYVQQYIGGDGRLIGVDLTDGMLGVARARVARKGWGNVELVQADVGGWPMPDDVDAIYSTLALTLVPEYDQVIRKAARALTVGGRMAVFDLKLPERWPLWLVRFAAWLNRPFGVTMDLADRHPWEEMRRYLQEIEFKEFYFGALYLSVGEKPGAAGERIAP
jgi:ubiquinone/menaquinone biosynthesis C-methylase UbiE